MRQGRMGMIVAAALSCAVASRGQSVQPVASVDLTKFSGTWYEQARLPDKAQKKCVGDVLALYALEDKNNHFSVVHTCSLKDDTPQVRNDSGKRKGGATDGRLQTSYFVLLSHKTWVLALDPNYQWALVGSPNHKSLRVYSRLSTLDPAVMADLKSRAAAQGFDVSRMVATAQSDRASGADTVRPAVAGADGAAR